MAARLTVLMVLADSGPGVIECVERVLAVPWVDELLVLDNASSDGMPAALLQHYAGDARLRVRAMGTNLGFGAAMNRGATMTAGDTLLLLNPDCLPTATDLGHLYQSLADDSRIGLVGALIGDSAGRLDPASRRRDPTLWRVLCSMLGLYRLERRWPVFSGVNVLGRAAPGQSDVDAVSGALMLVSRAAFVAVRGFDEGYFLHFEDLDLCRRLRQAGWRIVLDGEVWVVHGKGGSSQHRPVFVTWHKYRGLLRYLQQHDPVARRWPQRGLLLTLVWGHFLLHLPILFLRGRLARDGSLAHEV